MFSGPEWFLIGLIIIVSTVGLVVYWSDRKTQRHRGN